MVKTGKSGKEKHLECLIYSLSFDKYRFKEIVHSKNTILSLLFSVISVLLYILLLYVLIFYILKFHLNFILHFSNVCHLKKYKYFYSIFFYNLIK